VFPWIGLKPVNAIRPMDILAVLRRVEERGAIETTHRVQQNCGQVFRYAVATARAETDPSRDLRGALTPWKPEHYATLTDSREVGRLLRISPATWFRSTPNAAMTDVERASSATTSPWRGIKGVGGVPSTSPATYSP